MKGKTAPLRLLAIPFKAMGSPCELQFFAQNDDHARAVADLALADVARLEQRYSRYRPDSFLSEINQAAAVGGAVKVDDETASLLNYAVSCHAQSDGLFDITSGLLRRVWDFKSGKAPHRADVDELLERVGWRFVSWEAPLLRFERSGMELDFGGIVKEYAADRVASICAAHGVHHGYVNLGGDVRIIGPQPEGRPWRIGIQHPRRPGEPLEQISMKQGAVASSGDYERCIVLDGLRYGHILNPRTGWPVRHLAAVSVVGDFCVVAGSASTIAMLKEEDGPAWLAALGLPHLWVGVDGAIGGPLAPKRSKGLFRRRDRKG